MEIPWYFDIIYGRKFMRVFCIGFIVLILTSISARASMGQNDSGNPKDIFSMSIEELMDIPIVVSAARKEQKITEVSVPISIITSEDIHHSGLTSIPEILNFTPGVDVLRTDRNHYALGVRGLHEIWSDRTLVLINGRNLDSPVFGGTDWQFLPIMVEDIKQIEVVRGPGGAAWGANAFNGVINIITKKPEDLPRYFSSTTINEFGDSYTHLRWVETKGKYSWRTSLGYEDRKSSHDAISSDYEPGITDLAGIIDTSGIKVRDFSRSWKTDNEFIYHSSDETKWSFGASLGHFEQGDYEFLGYFPNKDIHHDTSRIFSKVEHDFSNDTFGYLQWFNNYSNSYRPPLLDYTDMENDLEGQLNFMAGPKHKISIGGNVRLIRINSKITDANDLVIANEPLDEDWLGLFIIDQWQATSRLTIENQYRWDKYSETHSDWSARLSALYSLDEDKHHILRLSGARAYRAPLASMRKFQTQRILVSPGLYAINLNPGNISNEELWSLEAGYSGQLNKKLSVQVDTYYQLYNNLIGYKDTPNPWGVIITGPQNVDGAAAYGGETELVWHEKWGKLSAWYAYNDFHPDKSYQEIRAYHPAKHKHGLNARIFLPGNSSLNGNYRYTSRTSFSDDETILPTTIGSTHRFDLSLSKAFNGKRGEFTIGITDVFNETKLKAPALGRLGNYETPGRMFFARLEFKF